MQARPAEIPADADLKRLKRLCERNPTSTIFARLADRYLELGNADRAVSVCEKGLRYRPSYITGHLVLGRAYMAVGDLRSAEDEFQKILRLEPDSPAATGYLAVLAERRGKIDRSTAFWDRLRALDPFSPVLPSEDCPETDLDSEQVDSDTEPETEGRLAERDAPEFPFVSLTLARLYASQGHRGQAERVARLVDPAQADKVLDQFRAEATN